MTAPSLTDCHMVLATRFWALQAEYRRQHPGQDLLLTCVHRTVAEQQALYARGRTAPGPILTRADGVTHPSNHNRYPSRAVDVAVLIGGKVTWDPAAYAALGPLALAYGLVWGGAWPTFQDRPHLELPTEVP